MSHNHLGSPNSGRSSLRLPAAAPASAQPGTAQPESGQQQSFRRNGHIPAYMHPGSPVASAPRHRSRRNANLQQDQEQGQQQEEQEQQVSRFQLPAVYGEERHDCAMEADSEQAYGNDAHRKARRQPSRYSQQVRPAAQVPHLGANQRVTPTARRGSVQHSYSHPGSQQQQQYQQEEEERAIKNLLLSPNYSLQPEELKRAAEDTMHDDQEPDEDPEAVQRSDSRHQALSHLQQQQQRQQHLQQQMAVYQRQQEQLAQAQLQQQHGLHQVSQHPAVGDDNMQQQQEELEDEYDEDEDVEFDPFTFIKYLPPPPLEARMRQSPLPRPTTDKICLALDLDETLVHCSVEPIDDYHINFEVEFNQQRFMLYVRKRPHLEKFLQQVSQWFEVVVFTASQQVYADRLLDILDPDRRLIQHRVFRDSCVCYEGNYLKDLHILGRELHRVAIVDNSVQAFGYQVDNGIPIESWYDDFDDEELLNLLPLLEELKDEVDTRPLIRRTFKLRDYIDRLDTSNSNSRRRWY